MGGAHRAAVQFTVCCRFPVRPHMLTNSFRLTVFDKTEDDIDDLSVHGISKAQCLASVLTVKTMTTQRLSTVITILWLLLLSLASISHVSEALSLSTDASCSPSVTDADIWCGKS